MTSVASRILYLDRQRLFGAAILFLTLLLADRSQPNVAIGSAFDQAVLSDPIAEAGMQLASADDCQWVDCPLVTDNHAQAPHFRSPSVRVELTFGDSRWNAVAGDEGEAVVATGSRRRVASSTLYVAPLWSSLQARNIRLQI